ncbi:hypothetical protein [Cohnella phaseoli]|uniref:DUF4145 domain-containing protein n=1 Tax=Cohnella phaseoli TaxID=456490 RepID=A0A3D9KAX9_9BACL|nr:hypothetical protein [Cohnella phaseoli]RED83285.1 hypothetical protein DFP98_108128 [Cohnella phaseoli]
MQTFNLFENAIDSIDHGLQHLSDYPDELSLSDAKQSIMNLINGLDLLILEKLRSLDEEAIFENKSKSNTLKAEEAYKRIKNELNEEIEDWEFKAYAILKRLRNNAVHYEFSFGDDNIKNISLLIHLCLRFIETELDMEIEELISNDNYQRCRRVLKDLPFGEIIEERYVDAIEADIYAYSYSTKGMYSAVLDAPCGNCGREGISIAEDFYPYGKCVFCEEQYNIQACERCGHEFDADWEGVQVHEDGDYLCDGCNDYYLND